MAQKLYELADKEFQPLLQQMFIDPNNNGILNVQPNDIICIRKYGSKNSKVLAYVRKISEEYQILTNKIYFMVIISEAFDALPLDRQMLTILHEYNHTYYDAEHEKFVVRDHDIKEFADLLKDPTDDTDLVKGYKYENMGKKPDYKGDIEPDKKQEEKKPEIKKQEEKKAAKAVDKEDEFI